MKHAAADLGCNTSSLVGVNVQCMLQPELIAGCGCTEHFRCPEASSSRGWVERSSV